MVNKEKIKKYIADFRKKNFDYVKERDLKVELIKNKAIAIVGPRRAGKTHLLYSRDRPNFIPSPPY